jgi:NAD(P)-dependent dehydrogenase (short-subunit alcohol dehydrogenase family)
MEAFTDALRHELGPFGIRVIAIRPAFIATQFNPTAQKFSSEIAVTSTGDYSRISNAALEGLGRLWKSVSPIEPESVADLIVDAVFSEAFYAANAIGPMASELLKERSRLDDDAWKDIVEDTIRTERTFGLMMHSS